MGKVTIWFDRGHSLTVGGCDKEGFESIWKHLTENGDVGVGSTVIFKDNITFMQFEETFMPSEEDESE